MSLPTSPTLPKLTFAQSVLLIALRLEPAAGIPYDYITRPMKTLLGHGFIRTEAGRVRITEAGEKYFTTK